MKKLFIMAMAVCLMTACEKEIMSEKPDGEASEVLVADVVKTKKFTFTLKGDFSSEWKPVTRSYLSADGKDMTDVWVLDYDADGNLLKQLHQGDNTTDDFGKPVMKLTYGEHHVYFIASRGVDPVLNTDAHTITFGSVRDTFWKRYDVNVVATSNGNRAVTLDRVVTKLALVFTDAISDDAATINFTPAKWYYGLNYKTGEPTNATNNQTNTMQVPANYAGRTDVSVSYFSISPSEEWKTDVIVNSKDADGNIIGQGVMTDVPLKRNRITEYSGPLFTAGGETSLTLNGVWDDAEIGTW
jgi:hypothetical protein